MFTLLTGKYQLMDLQQLQTVPVTPRGQRSKRWKGIQHGEFIQSVFDILSDSGIVPYNPQFAVSPSGAAMIGGFQLHHKGKRSGQGPSQKSTTPWSVEGIPQETVYAMGVRHANNSDMAVTCSIGAQVLVCENGVITGEDKWKRKHTTGLDIRHFIREGIDRFLEKVAGVKEAIERMLTSRVAPDQHDELLLQIARSHVVPWSMLERIDNYWNASLEGETPFSGGTSWDWYNAVTENVKRLPILDQPRALLGTYQLLTCR